MEMNVERIKVMRISRQHTHLTLPPVRIMIDQEEQENVEYFNYLCSMTRNDAKCAGEINALLP